MLLFNPQLFSSEEDADSDVEKQDDIVAEAVAKLKKIPIDTSHIPALTDKTFPVETKSRELLMVLFYLTRKPEISRFLPT